MTKAASSSAGHALPPPPDPGAASTVPPKTPLKIVFPPDNRQRVKPTTVHPFVSMGLLVMTFPNGETYTGTATLIDKTHLLTAAHNVFGNDCGGYATHVQFYPARNGNLSPYGVVNATHLFVTEDYRSLSPPNPNRTQTGTVDTVTEYTEDYAVVRLASAVNLPILGLYAPADHEIDGANAVIAGYPGDKPVGEMWAAQGKVSAPEDEFLFYKIDTYKGESGAAVLVNFPLPVGLAIAGVHVAGDPNLNTNFAVRMRGDRIRQIQAWMNS
jgi:glutamyl endopeptidase